MKIAITFILAAALAACGGKKSDNTGAGSGSGAGSAAMAAGSGSGSAAAGSGSGSAMAGSGSAAQLDLPTEADFEDQATTDITESNVESKLSAMEKDLGD